MNYWDLNASLNFWASSQKSWKKFLLYGVKLSQHSFTFQERTLKGVTEHLSPKKGLIHLLNSATLAALSRVYPETCVLYQVGTSLSFGTFFFLSEISRNGLDSFDITFLVSFFLQWASGEVWHSLSTIQQFYTLLMLSHWTGQERTGKGVLVRFVARLNLTACHDLKHNCKCGDMSKDRSTCVEFWLYLIHNYICKSVHAICTLIDLEKV